MLNHQGSDLNVNAMVKMLFDSGVVFGTVVVKFKWNP